MELDKYDKTLVSLEKIMWAMDDAVKVLWPGMYTGMMTSVGRVFANELLKKSLSANLPELLEEISFSTHGILSFEIGDDSTVYVRKCVVRDLIDKNVVDETTPLCFFIKGFLSKMFEGIGVKLSDVKFGRDVCTLHVR